MNIVLSSGFLPAFNKDILLIMGLALIAIGISAAIYSLRMKRLSAKSKSRN